MSVTATTFPPLSSSQLQMCALGFRQPLIQWQDVAPCLKDAAHAEQVIRYAALHDSWPPYLSSVLKKVKRPREALDTSARDVTRFQDAGASITTPLSEDYPRALLDLHYPPLALSYIGSPFWLFKRSISIVGSRDPRSETLRWMEHELPFLAHSGFSFVSGGARGVDQRAHAIAIRCEAPTGVILPSGLDQLYPSDLKGWVDEVVAGGGALISEFPMDQDMHRHHFLQRNRIVAGFSEATIIAQCGSKSGTWMTANYARNLSRSVAVLPGSVWDTRFSGSLDLIFEGGYAQLVRTGSDILSITPTRS